MCLTRHVPWAMIGELARAAHPLPTAAVTALTTIFAVVMELSWPRIGALIGAVLTGQLSVGWLNDLVDRDRDRASGRRDKPVALGSVSVPMMRIAIGIAVGVCVPLSLALGPAAGTAHLVAIAAAWAYNLVLKRTVWSWVPYALAFGLLPVVVWLASPAPGVPPQWMIGAAALLGVGAHGANVLPDLAADRATGVLGLPHRIPLTALRVSTAAVLLVASALLTLGPPGRPGAFELTALGLVVILAPVAGGLGQRLFPPRTPFFAVVTIAAVAAAVLVTQGAAS